MTEDKPRIELNAVQVVGGALAASSAAVAASLLGVAGTVIGAAVASIVATLAGAMYTHSMRRGREALERARTTHLTHLGRMPVRKPGSPPDPEPEPAAAASTDAERDDTATPADAPAGPAEDGEAARAGWRERFRNLKTRKVAITAACTLLLALGVITGVEALMGRPLSSALGIDGNQRGTSIGLLAENRQRPTPAQSPAATRSPSPGDSATPTGTTAVTRTPTRPTNGPTSGPATSSPGPTNATHAPTQAPATSVPPPPPPLHTAPDTSGPP